MTAIPKVLYHGTTMLRYAHIKRDGLMNANIPRFFKRDQENTPGYLYFTTSPEEAAYHGVNTLCVDIRMDRDKFVNKWVYDALASSRNIVILATKTSNLKHNFEVDPEMESRLIEHFEARRAAGGATLLATHSEALARKADRIIRLSDGRIVDD